MANIIDSSVNSISASKAYSIWRIVFIGIILGFVYWALTWFILRYNGSINIASNIATILVATLGILIMLYLHMARPLMVAVAGAASLWGLAQYTNGLSWLEVFVWNVLLYCLAYSLFLWITRYKKTTPVLIVIVAIIIIVRIAITL